MTNEGAVDLNEPQADAVMHVAGPLLVFAGAGSGKTRVITYRIAHLLSTCRVPPYRILAVTFTNKAAGEMRHRLERIVGGDFARDLWVGTFHSTCARLLRRHAEAVGLTSNFVIYDTQDQKTVVTRVLKELQLDDRRYSPKSVLGRIHKEKQEGRAPEDMSLDSYFDDSIKKVYTRYEAALRGANAVDFEDLILHVLRLVEGPDRESGGGPRFGIADEHAARLAREALTTKFDFVLVDEFQDTNRTQYRLLRALSDRTRNLCVVGDDDQSIYRWRGADVRNIRGFRNDYQGARVVKLEQNYRSSGRIVRAALAVIKPSRDREPKELWTDNEEGGKVLCLACGDERDEAAQVARMVREAREAGVSPREIAVFYRIHAQSRVLEEAMRASNQAYTIIGGMKFFERAEIKDALAYLRLLVNPRSDVDFLRVVNVPPRGIGQTTLERLQAHATSRGIPLSSALAELDQVADLGAAAKKRLGQMKILLEELSEGAGEKTPADALETVLEKSGYRAALRLEDSVEAESRLENLAELESSLSDYAAEAEARGEAPTLNGFLERVSLVADADTALEDERITLMTVHGAKGLEFEVVLLTGMEEDMFPYRGMDPGGADELDEERRLAYVAVTRARKHLVASHVRTRQIFGTTRVGGLSRFISGLPDDVVEHHTTPAAANTTRFVDRPQWSGYGSGASSGGRRPSSGASSWSHPQARAATPSRSLEPGERFVERDPDLDSSYSSDDGTGELRRGMKVSHGRFGEGEVRRVITAANEPAVVAFFPGWGEMKVLARFLRPV